MSYADRDGVIWMDGAMVPWREANTHVLTHSLHYATGAFEGIRAYKTERGTAIFRLTEHINRLYDTTHILGMKMTLDRAAVVQACLDCVRENKLETAYLRPLAFYGSEGMGLHAGNLSVHVIVAAWFWGAYLGGDALEKGIRIKTSSFTRNHVNSVLSKAKATGNYLNSIMALQDAPRRLRRSPAARQGRHGGGRQRREYLHRAQGRALHPGRRVCAGRHHPRHRDAAGA